MPMILFSVAFLQCKTYKYSSPKRDITMLIKEIKTQIPQSKRDITLLIKDMKNLDEDEKLKYKYI